MHQRIVGNSDVIQKGRWLVKACRHINNTSPNGLHWCIFSSFSFSAFSLASLALLIFSSVSFLF
ncbi:hypothetical protein EYF80_043494 [Liparis tanakae]|uniref:Uncharacterized protein n=1 Tax=Liparis tanakae TaxID=230148 RepID=A0A4Z2FYC8_9TELE|nr:hypothetical protein EYF80_043494 [Liparis tanakae]